MQTEYLLIASIDNKEANYSNEVYNYVYIQANFNWFDINNIKYSYDVSISPDCYDEYDYFVYVINNNSNSAIDIEFFPLNEKVVQETNYYYFEGTVNKYFQYAMNQYYQEDEPVFF